MNGVQPFFCLMEAVEDMGEKAYQKAMLGDHEAAIQILNRAIRKFPKERRFWNNRSYSYYHLKNYKSALEDSEHMVLHFPTYTKSYYRKAEALFGMKRFEEAAKALKELLQIDETCCEAKDLLKELDVQVLMKAGYDRTKAMKALGRGGALQSAKQLLRSGTVDGVLTEEIYYSDDESGGPNAIQDPQMDPSNPRGYASLWVGNVTESVTEEVLRPIFSRHGRIKSLIVCHKRFCAFVNYYDGISAGSAMKHLQGLDLGGSKLLIRYPNSAVSVEPVRKR